jgi:hypothetical protein
MNKVIGTTQSLNAGVSQFQTLDRRQRRDRGRDDRIAIEHRGADHAECQHDGAPASRQHPLAKRHQGQRAAFAVIVGAQQDQHVFDGHDQDQRPDDQRKNAQYIGAGRDNCAPAVPWAPAAAARASRKA